MLERYPGAIWRPGPLWKVGYSFAGESGPKRGDVKHSAEGWWAGIHSVLDGPAASSWQFTVGFDRVEQHYPSRAHCYHAGDTDDDGGVAANLDLVGIEHLGKGTPLTPYQIEETAKLTYWLAEQEGRDIFERFDGWTPDEAGVWVLAEHKEVSNTWTACPSDRIPWPAVFRELEKLMVDSKALARLTAAIATWQAYAAQGVPCPPRVLAELHYVLHLS